MILHSDLPHSLASTALITNAYLYTGEDKYKNWVLEYVEAWMDRIKKNNGIVPDNVGPTGKIGEFRDGQWWGGLYGWNGVAGFQYMFHSITIAAECAQLLSGDSAYLELLRSQIRVLLENSQTREDGQLLLPCRYGPQGWESFRPMRFQELAHLYHASMSREDYELALRFRNNDKERDWNQEVAEGEKNNGNNEYARFQYYDGKNPDWPEKMLAAEYQMVLEAYEEIRNENRNQEDLIRNNKQPPNPVFTKGLTQVTMGAPQAVYCGGLLRATVRYYDRNKNRPGLPPDVASLVDTLKADRVGIRLVNLNHCETRRVIVQAGAFGEHLFNTVEFFEEKGMAGDSKRKKSIPVNGQYFSVELPPSTSIRLDIGLNRFVNRPGYAFPFPDR